MDFRGRKGRRLFRVGGGFLVLCLLGGTGILPVIRAEVLETKGCAEMGSPKAGPGPEVMRLAEMVQREDSVVYRTDSKDSTYQQRQRDEREKEKKSWNMLNNLVIDGRQPPRRFSDPRINDSPQ